MPYCSSTRGRLFVIKTSACSISWSAIFRASSFSRSRTMPRLPRLSSSNGGLSAAGAPSAEAKRPRKGSPAGGSILITSAPQSASSAAQDGPATQSPISTTLMPFSGPAIACLLANRLRNARIVARGGQQRQDGATQADAILPVAMKVWLDDACSLADAIRRGEVSAADALEASLAAIAASKLNPIVTLDAEGARKAAAVIDERIKRREDPGLFAGVPLLVKDEEDAAGLPTSQGSIAFKHAIADQDSTHVARLRGAGAVIVGKAAMSEFGFVAYT